VKPADARRERSDSSAADETAPHPAQASLWEVFLSGDNLVRALRRVEQNAGAPGVDGMTTEELGTWLKERWSSVRSRLDAGTYRPQPVRRLTIPKPSGGERLLGVPTALDRLIQQALLQVFTPGVRPVFATASSAFGRDARPIKRFSTCPGAGRRGDRGARTARRGRPALGAAPRPADGRRRSIRRTARPSGASEWRAAMRAPTTEAERQSMPARSPSGWDPSGRRTVRAFSPASIRAPSTWSTASTAEREHRDGDENRPGAAARRCDHPGRRRTPSDAACLR
jgi:hypothetical protein